MESPPSLLERIEWRVRRACLAKPRRAWRAPSKDTPLVVAGLLSTANGIGQAARATLLALRELGHNPIPVDLSPVFHQQDIAAPLDATKMPAGKDGTLILCLNAPETQRALDALGMHFRRNWYTIGAWAWELPTVPEAWLGATRYLSEVWTPSDFVTDVFAPAIDIPVRTVPHYMPLPVLSPEVIPDRLGLKFSEDEVVCLIMADGRSSFERKNVFAAVRMYFDAFPGDRAPKLVIKSRNITEYPDFSDRLNKLIGEDARVSLLDKSIPQTDLRALQSRCDILLSPHRSEGFGLHLAECMAHGRAVVTTGWSGNMQFMREDGAVLLPYTLVPVNDPFGVYKQSPENVWAAPDHAAGVAALQKLFTDETYREQIGHVARRNVEEHLGLAAYRDALSQPPVDTH